MRLLALLFCLASLRAGEPLVIGLVGEMSHSTSTSGQAIERGLRLAVSAINAGGGLLGGRQLRLEVRDSRSIPARGVAELRELAGRPEVVAVVGGKFSLVVLESLPAIHELRMPYLLPWSAADGIIDHAYRATALLARLGAEVGIAEDGAEAIRLAAAGGWDVCLMDCQMPVVDGYEATAAIRAREAGGAYRLPILAMTANAMDGDRERCLAAGMDDHIPKPVTGAALAAALHRWDARAGG